MARNLLLVFIYICFSSWSMGQVVIPINIVVEAGQSDAHVHSVIDSLEAQMYITDWVNKKVIDGYADINVDYKSDSLVHLYSGMRYEIGGISIAEKYRPLILSAGLRTHRWDGKALNQQNLATYVKKIINYFEKTGYPFAKVSVDSSYYDGHKLYGQLRIEEGDRIIYDSLTTTYKINVNQGFLEQHLGIRYGEPFDMERILEISKRIDELPYLSMSDKPIYRLFNRRVGIELGLKENPASRFDFLIGVLPSSENGSQKFNVIGEFTGEIQNRLGYGEYFYANVNRYSKESQSLNLKTVFPYLSRIPFGASSSFDLFRNGSQFIETKSMLGLTYQLGNKVAVETSFNFKSSRLIEIDSATIVNTLKLPKQLDVSFSGLGINFSGESLDYKYNPSKGFVYRLGTVMGRKKIIRNRAIEALVVGDSDFTKSYDTLDLSSIQLETTLNLAYYHPVSDFGTIKVGLNAAFMYNESTIYNNELYRIGGNNDLRGFDELSIVSDQFYIATTEFRFLLDKNSYLSLPFIDYGYAHTLVGEELVWDTVLGAGMGISFATGVGVFQVSFAVGRRLDLPIDFNNTKIHFGYVSIF